MKQIIAIAFSLFIFSIPLHGANKEIGLKVGTQAPSISQQDVDGKSFDLSKAAKKGPVVLVFYRGGWCPYCNIQLRNLQKDLVPQLGTYKAQLVAISVDKVDEAMKTKNKEKLGMTLLSDPAADLIKKYNIVNQVEDKLVKKYKSEYKIDLEAASGQKHHMITIPAVFVVNKKSEVAFAYANEDYKVRAQIKDIVEALKKL
ncbi:MAG: redoxin domain-containing protein [Bdellovibrionales bacterium]|nr:peroxiredoxin family protein [Bdellovibrionales bacterium]NQZ20107.1 redoxin domain-containing protein [Bdellovibrionales bacterium]